MIDYRYLTQALRDAGLDGWAQTVPQTAQQKLTESGHGDLQRWLDALQQLPDVNPSGIQLNRPSITVGNAHDCTDQTRRQLEQQLRNLWPWRKGPFNLFGLKIDTEWRSDLKWERVQPHMTPLNDRVVLDVGCGSGYHCWRMEGEGAKLVIGIDPTLVYVMQYHALQRYIQSRKTVVLPFSSDTMPPCGGLFDTVFSMGVLYHRRSPIDHLTQMWDCLQWEGELVLETLVVEGDVEHVLMPERRYAKMRNVWFLPSCDALSLWLKRCNFENIRCVDVNQTSTEEQRATDWMHFESLADFLDPHDRNKTIEGYPAPRRALFIANKPRKPHKNLS